MANEHNQLYTTLVAELENIIACGYGELRIVVSNSGTVIDVIPSTRERFKATQNGFVYEGNPNTTTNK